MLGVSRTSLARAKDGLSALAPQADLVRLADELRQVLHLFDREHALRRVLADPAHPAERRATLLGSLLGDQVSAHTSELLTGVVRDPWGKGSDLTDAVETLAVLTEVIAAESGGELDDLEDELFRFGRIVDGQPQLRSVLSDPAIPGERKAGLVRSLLEGKATQPTVRLVSELVAYPRGRSLDGGLNVYAKLAAQRRARLVAVVRAAAPLTEGQRDRLAAALRRAYGREVHLNIEVDPDVVGGFSVQVGDEVIDGTVAGRLAKVRRRLAG